MTNKQYKIDQEKVESTIQGLEAIAMRDAKVIDFGLLEEYVSRLTQGEQFFCLELVLSDSVEMHDTPEEEYRCAREFESRDPVPNKKKIEKKKLATEIQALLELRELLTCDRICAYAKGLSRKELEYVVCLAIADSLGIPSKIEDQDLYSALIPVDEEFSKFVAEVFADEEIVYIGDLITKDEEFFEEIPNFGKQKMMQVTTYLEKHNLGLDMCIPDWVRPVD